MTRKELADALAQTTQADRDLAEKIINNPKLVSIHSPGYGEYKALEVAGYHDRVGLARLRSLGLIGFNNGFWSWIAGPISDFFALRIDNNFA